MKKFRVWTCSALTLSLVAAASGLVAAGQIAPRRLSTTSQNVLQQHESDLESSAKIYGYDLTEGKWTVSQAPCAAMPNTVLLRYHRGFTAGAESIFVAAVPRGAGRVRIVPVLYRGATPFVPAPINPRNVTLFNQLVGQSFRKGNSVELSACYAAFTGVQVNPETGSMPKVKIAGAPVPTIHLEPKGKLLGVTLATRESAGAYKLWDLSLNHAGQVRSVTTKDQPVYAAAPQSSAQRRPPVNSTALESQVTQPAAEPGWKFIPPPPDPPSKVIPPAPQPSVVLTPEP